MPGVSGAVMRLAPVVLAAMLSGCGSAAPSAPATDLEAPVDAVPSQMRLPTMKDGDGQNIAVPAPGALRIEGDPATRYDIQLPTDVLFDFDRAELRPDAQPLLRELKAHFASTRTDQVHVRGHTDAKGSDQHNYVLSMMRAKAVCDWLKRETAVGATMCIGRGETEPLRPDTMPDGSDDPVGRQLNRRVTVSVVVYPDVNAMLDRARAQAADRSPR